MRNVAILLFDDVEVLDFAGPFEVFSVTRQALDDNAPFNVFTVAQTAGPISARNGLSLNPDYTLADSPHVDILVVPGGRGTRALMDDTELLSWIQGVDAQTELTLSVCTGSLLLGRAGLLDGLTATTHHTAFDDLREAAPTAQVDEKARYVDNGHIITAAGISAGIDSALYVIAKLVSGGAAWSTAHYMEYDWDPERFTTGGVS